MCGIFGIVHDTNKAFDKRLFCTLGINNDTRGGDSCGIVIDGSVEYGVDKEKYFEDFMSKSKLLKNTVNCKYAIGHDRKASVGKVSLETAQPVVFKDNNGKVIFAVIHNGTIHNYLDLADKYIPGIDCKDMTDSQVMATIFFNAGYDCLAEYHGGAVFFIVDDRGPKTRYFAYKGASKKGGYTTYYAGSKNDSDKVIDERPFFYISQRKSVIFSSIHTYLKLVGDKIYTIHPNSLIEFKNGNPYIIQEFDRSECTQSSSGFSLGRKYKYTSSYNPNSYGYGGRYAGVDDDDDDYDGYMSWWERQEMYQGNNNNNNNAKQLTSGTKEEPSKPSKRDKSKLDEDEKRAEVNIVYDQDFDLYFNQDRLCHGEYGVSKYGFGAKYTGNKTVLKHYFWCGVHLYSKECFEFLEEFRKNYNFNALGVINAYPNLVHFLSSGPWKLTHEKNGKFSICDTYYTHKDFDGDVYKAFCAKMFHVEEGIVKGMFATSFLRNYDLYKDKNKIIDFSVLRKVYMK